MRLVTAGAVLLTMSCASASAQEAIACTAFMHNRDGSWRSLEDQSVFAASGRVHVAANAMLRPTETSPLGAIARALNEICEIR